MRAKRGRRVTLDAGEMNRKYGGKIYRDFYKLVVNDILAKHLSPEFIRWTNELAATEEQTYCISFYKRGTSERVLRQVGKLHVFFDFRPLIFTRCVTQLLYQRNVTQKEEEHKELCRIVARAGTSLPPERTREPDRHRTSAVADSEYDPKPMLEWGMCNIYGRRPDKSLSMTPDSFLRKVSERTSSSTGVQTRESIFVHNYSPTRRLIASHLYVEKNNIEHSSKQPSEDLSRRYMLDSIRTLKSRHVSAKGSALCQKAPADDTRPHEAVKVSQPTPVTLATSNNGLKPLDILRSLDSCDLLHSPKFTLKQAKSPLLKATPALQKKSTLAPKKGKGQPLLNQKSLLPEGKREAKKILCLLAKRLPSGFAQPKLPLLSAIHKSHLSTIIKK